MSPSDTFSTEDWVKRTQAKSMLDNLTTADAEFLTPKSRQFLARLRLGYIPFAYLVPDERLLPQESLRFFYIDRNWTDRLVEGALSIGKVSLRDLDHHNHTFQLIRAAVDRSEATIRDLRMQRSEIGFETGSGATLCGFLLRSALVREYPGLTITATRGTDGDKINLLRMELLSDDILICIFDQEPSKIQIHEPGEGGEFSILDAAEADTEGNIPGLLNIKEIKTQAASQLNIADAGTVTAIDLGITHRGSTKIAEITLVSDERDPSGWAPLQIGKFLTKRDLTESQKKVLFPEVQNLPEEG